MLVILWLLFVVVVVLVVGKFIVRYLVVLFGSLGLVCLVIGLVLFVVMFV